MSMIDQRILIRMCMWLYHASQAVLFVLTRSFLSLGAHTLSGAVLDPKALDELFPDWKDRGVSWAVGW